MEMKVYAFTGAVLASVVGAAATAHATAPAAINATEHGVAYTVGSPDGRSAVATAANGRFVAVAGADSVALINAAGTTVTTIPLGLRTESGLVGIAASIGEGGRTLTLTPQSAAPAVHLVDDADTTARKQHNAGVGALVGAGIGAVLGFFLGGVGALVTIPIGAGIGALIGLSTP